MSDLGNTRVLGKLTTFQRITIGNGESLSTVDLGDGPDQIATNSQLQEGTIRMGAVNARHFVYRHLGAFDYAAGKLVVLSRADTDAVFCDGTLTGYRASGAHSHFHLNVNAAGAGTLNRWTLSGTAIAGAGAVATTIKKVQINYDGVSYIAVQIGPDSNIAPNGGLYFNGLLIDDEHSFEVLDVSDLPPNVTIIDQENIATGSHFVGRPGDEMDYQTLQRLGGVVPETNYDNIWAGVNTFNGAVNIAALLTLTAGLVVDAGEAAFAGAVTVSGNLTAQSTTYLESSLYGQQAALKDDGDFEWTIGGTVGETGGGFGASGFRVKDSGVTAGWYLDALQLTSGWEFIAHEAGVNPLTALTIDPSGAIHGAGVGFAPENYSANFRYLYENANRVLTEANFTDGQDSLATTGILQNYGLLDGATAIVNRSTVPRTQGFFSLSGTEPIIIARSSANENFLLGVRVADAATPSAVFVDWTSAGTWKGEINLAFEADLIAVEGRVTTNEGDIDTLQSNVGTLQTNVGTLLTDVDALQTDVGSLQTDVSTLQTDVTNLTGRVSTNETNIGTLQTDVNAIETDLSTFGLVDTSTSIISTSSVPLSQGFFALGSTQPVIVGRSSGNENFMFGVEVADAAFPTSVFVDWTSNGAWKGAINLAFEADLLSVEGRVTTNENNIASLETEGATQTWVSNNYSPLGHTHVFGDITDTIADNQVPQTAVTQHEAALTVTESQISDLRTYELLSNKGAVGGYAPLNASGIIPDEYMPNLAISEVYVVADITARDALSVQIGDIAIVQDASGDPEVDSGGATYIRSSSDWKRTLSPTDKVTTVNGQSGDVVLELSDVGSYGSGLTLATNTLSIDDAYFGTMAFETASDYSLATHTHAFSELTGSIGDAQVPQSAITQHEAALAITESQITDFGNYALAGHTHDAADIVSGTLADSLLPTTQSGKTFTSAITVNASENEVAYFTDASGGTNTSPYTFRFDEPRDFRLWAGGTNGVGDVLTAEYATGNVNVNTGQLSEQGLRVATRTWVSTNYATAGHVHAAADVTSGTFADARIAQTNVTQYEAALTITESQISDLQNYALATHSHDGLVTGVSGSGNGTLQLTRAGTNISTDLSHTHAAGDITSGTLADARISQTSVTQHQGALAITESQITDLQNYALVGHVHSAADITTGTLAYNRIPTIRTNEVDFADQALNVASSPQFNKVNSSWYDAVGVAMTISAGGIGSAMNTNVTGEVVHIGGETGVAVYSSPDDMSSGWAGLHKTTLIDTNGDATFARNITLGNSIFGTNAHEIKFNQSTSYIEFNTSGVRTDIVVDRVYIDGASEWIDGTKVANWNTAYGSRPTGISGSGNGTLTLTRAGVTNLTADLSHTHSFNDMSDSINDAQVPLSAVTQHVQQIKVYDETGTELTF